MQHRTVDTRTEVTFCLNLEASIFILLFMASRGSWRN